MEVGIDCGSILGGSCESFSNKRVDGSFSTIPSSTRPIHRPLAITSKLPFELLARATSQVIKQAFILSKRNEPLHEDKAAFAQPSMFHNQPHVDYRAHPMGPATSYLGANWPIQVETPSVKPTRVHARPSKSAMTLAKLIKHTDLCCLAQAPRASPHRKMS
jgi:hypothetical protein